MCSKGGWRILPCYALCVLAGIFISAPLRIPFLPVFILSWSIFICCLRCHKQELVFACSVCVLFFTIGSTLVAQDRIVRQDHILNFLPRVNPPTAIVRGAITSDVEDKSGTKIFMLKVCALQQGSSAVRASGNILVSVRSGQAYMRADELYVQGKLCPLSAMRQGRYREYLRVHGVCAVMRVTGSTQCVPIPGRADWSVVRMAAKAQKALKGAIYCCTSGRAAAILAAMVLGDSDGVPWYVNDIMMRSGTVHILVVSGFNVGLVCVLISATLKALRIRRFGRICISVLCVIGYCLITGASTPVMRATVMALFCLPAALLKREPDIKTALAAALLFIVSFSPQEAFGIGFQLSFASVAGLAYGYPAAKKLLRIEQIKLLAVRVAAEAGLVSTIAWCATMPLIAFYFRAVSLVTVLANIVIVPLATAITLCGFVLAASSAFLPSLALRSASCAEAAVVLLLKANAFFVALPGAYVRF